MGTYKPIDSAFIIDITYHNDTRFQAFAVEMFKLGMVYRGHGATHISTT